MNAKPYLYNFDRCRVFDDDLFLCSKLTKTRKYEKCTLFALNTGISITFSVIIKPNQTPLLLEKDLSKVLSLPYINS